ncbi:MAG: response regulator transcription factor [Chitinophagaceae bacterium]
MVKPIIFLLFLPQTTVTIAVAILFFIPTLYEFSAILFCFNPDLVNYKLVNSIISNNPQTIIEEVILNDKERTFLKYCCTELGYKQIAELMCVSFKTVENYREQLGTKLNIHSRVGLAMYAVKNGLI